MLLWPGGARADACGAFHMRARYGFQHETGESVLADTIEWRHIGRGMALKEPDGKDEPVFGNLPSSLPGQMMSTDDGSTPESVPKGTFGSTPSAQTAVLIPFPGR